MSPGDPFCIFNSFIDCLIVDNTRETIFFLPVRQGIWYLVGQNVVENENNILIVIC